MPPPPPPTPTASTSSLTATPAATPAPTTPSRWTAAGTTPRPTSASRSNATRTAASPGRHRSARATPSTPTTTGSALDDTFVSSRHAGACARQHRLSHSVLVPCRVAPERRQRPRALQPHVQVVLERVADAAVHLQRRPRDPPGG